MQILAHRGASKDAPENTLAAFEEAVRQGADGVELDVQICASGEVVVCHDESLERLAGVDWEILHTPYWKLKNADVGTPLGFSSPARIPLLSEVLDLLPPSLLINVELKCETVDDHALTERTVEVIRDHGAQERVLISSFNPLCLIRLTTLAPELRRGYLMDPNRSAAVHGQIIAPLVATHSVHPHFSQVTASRARQWQDRGYKLAVWTVDDEKEARRLQSLGVDYLITNRPGQLRVALQ